MGAMKTLGLILLAAAGTILISCNNAKSGNDPVAGAIKDKIAATVGAESANVKIYNLEKVDSVRLGEELERRKATINLRIKKNGELLDRYMARNMNNNATLKVTDIEKDRRRLTQLDSIAAVHASQLDSVIAFDYLVNGEAKGADGAKVLIDNMFTSVTPDLKVLAFEKEKRFLRKSTGHAIPGYDALYSAASEEE